MPARARQKRQRVLRLIPWRHTTIPRARRSTQDIPFLPVGVSVCADSLGMAVPAAWAACCLRICL